MYNAVERKEGKLQADIHRVYMHAACCYACLAVKRIGGEIGQDVRYPHDSLLVLKHSGGRVSEMATNVTPEPPTPDTLDTKMLGYTH